MAQKNFKLRARVNSESPLAIESALEQIIADKGTVKQTDQGFEVEVELEGENARDLNRTILSELRRAEKHTRIRAEWASGDTVERFFDYVPKGTRMVTCDRQQWLDSSLTGITTSTNYIA